MVSFSHAIFYVADVSAALEFYKAAFDLHARFVHESGAYAELDTGSTAIAFASEELGAMNLPNGYQRHVPAGQPLGAEIVLTTEDVAGAYEQALANGAASTAPPSEKPWGQTVAYLRDPNGVLVELASPIAAD